MTTVVELYGSSGSGKSTCAAGLFYEMKMLGLDVEQVTEFCKKLAWKGQEIKDFDQMYLLGKQSNSESILYGKVDLIVTDSPIVLSGVYERYWSGGSKNYAGEAARSFIQHTEEKGIIRKRYFFSRTKAFNPKGRFETESQSDEVSGFMRNYLNEHEIPFTDVTVSDRERVSFILNDLGLT